MSEFGITAPLDQAMFVHKRDMNQRFCSEGFNYSVEALENTFGKRLTLSVRNRACRW